MTNYLNGISGMNVHVGEDHGELSAFRMSDLIGALLVVRVVRVTESRRRQSSVVTVQNGVTAFVVFNPVAASGISLVGLGVDVELVSGGSDELRVWLGLAGECG